MTGISSVTVNNMVDDTGDGISGTPYNKTFMLSLINDLIATALPLDGSVAMTGALQELFIGLVRKLNPNGTAHIYEYAGGLLATTTSPTGAGFQQAWVYNVPLATTTVPPTVNNWGGRDITDFCVLIQFLDTGVFEIWFAPSAAAGVAPVWGTGPVYSFNTSTGSIDVAILNALASVNARSAAQLTQISSDWGWPSTSTSLPLGWGATVNNAADITYSDSAAGEPATYLFPTISNQGPTILTLNRFSNAVTNGKYYFYARMRLNAIATSTDLWKCGWNNTSGLVGGNTDMIAVYFGTDSNLYLRVRKASVNVDTLLQAYSLNTWYNITIEWLCGASIVVYINGILKTTYTGTANFPTVTLFPYLGSTNQIGGQNTGAYISASSFGKIGV